MEQKSFVEKMQKSKQRSEALNETIKELLIYVGFASAIISAIAYVVVTIVMVRGFNADFGLANQIVFSILGAVVGLSIQFSLQSQGIAFAKRDEEAQRVMREYHDVLNKTKSEKELREIGYHVMVSAIFQILVKGTMLVASNGFILYVFLEGNGNWALVGLAFANIFMFTGFGLVSLAKMYDKYLEEHIPVIREKIKRIKEKVQADEREAQEEEKIDEIVVDWDGPLDCKPKEKAFG